MSGFWGGLGGPAARERVLVVELGGAEHDSSEHGGADVDAGRSRSAARRLRDAGFEVVVAGSLPSAAGVAAVARDEDVDAVVVAGASPGADRGPVVDVEAALGALGLAVAVVAAPSGAGSSGDHELVAALERALGPAPDTGRDVEGPSSGR